MSLRYDATVKDMAQVNPRGLLSAFDTVPPGPVSLLNIDLSTVTTSTDVVFGVGDPLLEIVHLDFQSSASATKHLDILVYGALLHRQYQVGVHSIVVLLRPQAAHRNLTGSVAYAPRPRRGKMDFGYEVVRLWERPAAELLAAEVGAAPLAMLGMLPIGVQLETGLADLVHQLVYRLDHDAPPEHAKRLLTSAYVLTGLRVPKPIADDLFKGERAMRDSVTYMGILEEGIDKGRLVEVRDLIRRFGRKRLGAPGKRIIGALDAIDNLKRLEALLERVGEVETWQELLAAK